MVTALAGAALTRLTLSPRYSPLAPSFLRIIPSVPKTPLSYAGILCPPAYLVRMGPCTCNLFLTVSNGNTALFDRTEAVIPATASPEPNGSFVSANAGFKPSYSAKKSPMYGTICPTPALRPRKKPAGPSCCAMSRKLARRPEYIRSGPCAAKRVLSRSSGYVAVVAAVPATAPATKDFAVPGT